MLFQFHFIIQNDRRENLTDSFCDLLAAHGNSGLNFLAILIDHGNGMEFLCGYEQFVVREFDRECFERFSDSFDVVDNQRELDDFERTLLQRSEKGNTVVFTSCTEKVVGDESLVSWNFRD